MSENYRYAKADTVTRQDVRVSRDGWVTHKRDDTVIGMVVEAPNAVGVWAWRGSAGDFSRWAESRRDAIARVIELHNMQEKARAYDLLSKMCGL